MITNWIPVDPAEPVEEHNLPENFFFEGSRETVKEYLGGSFEFVQVLVNNEPMYMLVHEVGALIPLPVNLRATDHYHNAQVKPRCEADGIEYVASDFAQIHGPAILVRERMT
jgi:hypothetical protein